MCRFVQKKRLEEAPGRQQQEKMEKMEEEEQEGLLWLQVLVYWSLWYSKVKLNTV